MPLKAHGLLLGILLLIIQIVVDAALTISTPAPGSQIRQGGSVFVTWSGLESNASIITITLGEGATFSLRAILGTIPASTGGSKSVVIPTTVAAGTDYYIRLATNDIPAIAAVQGPFSVISSISSSSSSASSSSSSSSSALPSASSVTLSSSATPSSLSSSTVSSTSSSAETNTPTDTFDENSSGNHDNPPVLSTGAIAGVAVGAVAVFGLALAGCLCIRRQNKEDGQLADHTAAEIFAAQANYTKKKKSAAKSPPMVNANYPTSPRQQQQSDQYYSTGYDDPYYNYNTANPAYDQQQQYAGYGYHPAAALTPQNQTATYGGYSNEPGWANNQHHYMSNEQQPYTPTNAYYQDGVSGPPAQYQQPYSTQQTHNPNNA